MNVNRGETMENNLNTEPEDMDEDAELSRANNVAENSIAGMYEKLFASKLPCKIN